jgi:hypothetical protein
MCALHRLCTLLLRFVDDALHFCRHSNSATVYDGSARK